MSQQAPPAPTDQQLSALPVFPLPRAVLFPHTLLPLHIFEPRYREMIAHCLEHGSLLGIACIKPGHEAEQAGNPPLLPIAGVGELVRHERLADGRFNILLRGLARIRLVEELDHGTTFRVHRAERCADVWPDHANATDAKVTTVRSCLTSLMQRLPSAAELLSQTSAEATDAASLTDALAGRIFTRPEVRQELLETFDVERRLDLIIERLADVLVALASNKEQSH